MRNLMMIGSAAILSVALTECNQNTASNAPTPTQTAATESKSETVSAMKDGVAVVGQLSAGLTSSTKGFVEGAVMGDLYEIEASKLAAQRARSKEVEDFAKMMIDAHTKTSEDLKAALVHSDAPVSIPTSFDSRHQGLIDDLKGAKPEDFDGRYLAQQMAAHEEALILMRAYSKDGDNADLKAFAANTAPKVQMHVDMLKQLDSDLKARQRRADNREP